MKIAVFGEGGIANRVSRDLFDSGIDVVRFPGAFELTPELNDCALAVCTDGLDATALLAAAAGCIDRGIPVVARCQTEEGWEALGAIRPEAGEADLPVLGCVGWSPGISNLMARAGYEILDDPRQIRVSWIVPGSGTRSALRRVQQSVSGTAVSFEGGAWIRSAAGEFEEQVFFPEPLGWQVVRLASGIEPMTLPSALPGVERIVVKGGIAGFGSDWAFRKAGGVLGRWAARLPSRGGGWSGLRVDVTGHSSDGSRTVTFGLLDLIPNLEAVPLVTCALMILDGEIKGSGLFAPEEVIEPGRFFERIAERGLRVAKLDRTL